MRVGIVVSQFNKEVSDVMKTSCVEKLITLGVNADDISCVEVPGALEIPIALDALAKSGKFESLIALGSVIRGDTYHFEIVSNESARGIMTVQLETGIPIANGVLTCENSNQVEKRMERKAGQCAEVAIDMKNLLDLLNER